MSAVSVKQIEFVLPACSGCAGEVEDSRLGQRYCLACHNGYMRMWRQTHRLNAEQRRKDNCRSVAGVAYRRGEIVRQDCATCSSGDSQMHHPDYARPLLVVWLCRPCHMDLHRIEDQPAFERAIAYAQVRGL